jgi:hypothetical protein
MIDLIFVAILIASFALSVVFVKACDRIIGPSEDGSAAQTGPASPSSEKVAA